MRARQASILGAVLGVAALVSCRQPPSTNVLVRVRAVGFAAPAAFDALRVRVYAVNESAGGALVETPLHDRSYPEIDAAALATTPFSVVLVPGAAVPADGRAALRVEVLGLRAGVERAATQVVTRYDNGASRIVELTLYAACAGLDRRCLDERGAPVLERYHQRCIEASGGARCVPAYDPAPPAEDGGAFDAADDNRAPDAAPDAALDVAPDVALDVALDAALDVAPDAALDAALDVALDVAPDVAPDAVFDAANCPLPEAGAVGACTAPTPEAACNALAGPLATASERCASGVDRLTLAPFADGASALEVWAEAPVSCNTTLRARRMVVSPSARALRPDGPVYDLHAGLLGAHTAPSANTEAGGVRVTWLYQPTSDAPVQVLSAFVSSAGAGASTPTVVTTLEASSLPRGARLFTSVLAAADLGGGPRDYLVGCAQPATNAATECFSAERAGASYRAVASFRPGPGALVGASVARPSVGYVATSTDFSVLLLEAGVGAANPTFHAYRWVPRAGSTAAEFERVFVSQRALRRDVTAAVYAPFAFGARGCTTSSLVSAAAPMWHVVAPTTDNGSVQLVRFTDEGTAASSSLPFNPMTPVPELASLGLALSAECGYAVVATNRSGAVLLRGVPHGLSTTSPLRALHGGSPLGPLAVAPTTLGPAGLDPAATMPDASATPQLVLYGTLFDDTVGAGRGVAAGLRWLGGRSCQ